MMRRRYDGGIFCHSTCALALTFAENAESVRELAGFSPLGKGRPPPDLAPTDGRPTPDRSACKPDRLHRNCVHVDQPGQESLARACALVGLVS